MPRRRRNSINIVYENIPEMTFSMGEYVPAYNTTTTTTTTTATNITDMSNTNTTTNTWQIFQNDILRVVRLSYPNTIRGDVFQEFPMSPPSPSISFDDYMKTLRDEYKKINKKKDYDPQLEFDFS
jgi:methionine synthase II (cobalamin-independent)